MYFFVFSILTFLASVAVAKVQFLGVAIAGGDFGCQIDGTCPLGSTQLALSDGPAQMSHFVKEDGMNLMRLPISWQFLVNNQLGSNLDDTSLAKYDQLMKACLDAGAYCMIDIHNFARWDGEIIGQGGPTDEQFASLWAQLATKYASSDKVVFELMNEPHDLDIAIWAQTSQKAVTAIRQAGATSQMILLSGTNFDSAATLVSSGSADALMNITNPDGSTDNLILDIHKYLDVDNSGTHAACTTDNVDAFKAVADYLRNKGRKGLISETGASSDPSCMTAFCSQNTFINSNSDVFMGLVAWGAGSFSTSYVLSMTPSTQNGQLIDNTLMQQCVLGTWMTSASSTATALTSATTSLSTIFSSAPVSTTKPILSTQVPVQNTTATRSTSKSRVTNTMKATTWDTSYYLVLTTTVPESEISTLAIATDTPKPSGLDGLLSSARSSTAVVTEGSGNATPSTLSSPSATTPTAGAARDSENGRHIWSLCLVVILLAALR